MEGVDEMGLIGGNHESGAMIEAREEESENKSGSEHMEAASGDEQERPRGSKRKKKYHRHTPYQIQELEGSFKENPHPDEKQRLELGRRLNLENKQVKFWFQNRRTQMKTQLERHENLILKQENDKLQIENIAIKEAMRNPICGGCGGGAILGEISFEENHLRIENARLKDELNRISVLTSKFLGRPLSPLAGPFAPAASNSNLELAVGRNGFGDLNPGEAVMPMGFNFGAGYPNTMRASTSTRPPVGMTGLNTPFEKSLLLELATNAMNELLKLTQTDNPLWFKSSDGSGEFLNLEEYTRMISPCIDKTSGLRTEGTRATGLSTLNSVAFVEMMMDANRWGEMFTGMIGNSYTLDVISSGMGGSTNGALQVMHAEIQVISPLVPTRQVRFLRFCKQHGDGVWAVVDVSIDAIQGVPNAQTSMHCKRLPSGCVVQDMPNGYSKIIWVEQAEYDESSIHRLYRPLLRSGMGFGAQKWVATLQRQSEFLATVMPSAGLHEDHSAVMAPTGRASMAKLAQRMTRNFCAGVCATVHNWEVVQVGNVGEGARLMMRKNVHSLGEPSGIVLSATLSVWMPVKQQQLFDLLQNEDMRSRWDLLSHGGPMQQMACIAKGQDFGNKISLLSAKAMGDNSNQSNVLILQETSNDAFGSLIVSTAVDMASMNVVMNGGESACIAILPSGFAIVPDCFDSAGPSSSLEMMGKESGCDGVGGGCLLTVGFQIMINDFPASKLTAESVENVNNLISRTIHGIKEALHCN